MNALTQVVLKIASPGVPDIYQGNEVWDFSLVDPDNRRPVDFAMRINQLESIRKRSEENPLELLKELIGNPEDGRIKLYLTFKALHARRRLAEVFVDGKYIPLPARGERQNHIIAFMRKTEKQFVIAIAGRFFYSLVKDHTSFIDPTLWKNTLLTLPSDIGSTTLHNLFTGAKVNAEKDAEGALKLDLSKILDPIPFALLEGHVL